jgi:hypothetical protein
VSADIQHTHKFFSIIALTELMNNILAFIFRMVHNKMNIILIHTPTQPINKSFFLLPLWNGKSIRLGHRVCDKLKQ